MIAFWFTDSVGVSVYYVGLWLAGCFDSRFPVAGAVGQVSWCCGCCAFRFAGFAGCFRGAGVVFSRFGFASGFGSCGIWFRLVSGYGDWLS